MKHDKEQSDTTKDTSYHTYTIFVILIIFIIFLVFFNLYIYIFIKKQQNFKKGVYFSLKFVIFTTLKEFNSIVRYSFNRFQDGLKEKEIRSKVNELFKNNCWFNQCAIKVGQQLFKKHKDKLNAFINKSTSKML